MKTIVRRALRIWEWGSYNFTVSSHLKETDWHTGQHDRAHWMCQHRYGRERSSEAGLISYSSTKQGDLWHLVSTIHGSWNNLGVCWQSQCGYRFNDYWPTAFESLCSLSLARPSLYICLTFDQSQCSLENLWITPWLSEKEKAQHYNCKFWCLRQLFITANLYIHILIMIWVPMYTYFLVTERAGCVGMFITMGYVFVNL